MSTNQSNNLRPCPFCGVNNWQYQAYFSGTTVCQCGECGTIADGSIINTRPIEDELRKRIAELEAAQRWHVVDDGDLPIVGKSIMFYDSSSEEIYRGVYTASHHWRANYFSEKCGTVTHWMPLPELPEVQE